MASGRTPLLGAQLDVLEHRQQHLVDQYALALCVAHLPLGQASVDRHLGQPRD